MRATVRVILVAREHEDVHRLGRRDELLLDAAVARRLAVEDSRVK
jgi:hypothetical protein